jgi:organic hydroperoxide reductase OsmC/OhrA
MNHDLNSDSNSTIRISLFRGKEMASTVFTSKLHSTSAEKIHSITLGGNQSTTVCPPPMLQEQPGSTSPHHLFLAAIGACVNLVFEIAIRKAHLELIDISSDIKGHYETNDETQMSQLRSLPK